MSGELSQEDNPFFEKQWEFVTAVANLVKPLREQKAADIGSPLLQGVQHALDKHQIPETKAQVNVDSAIEDIAALLFDGVYSCDFIHDPLLLNSGYTIDKTVFNILSPTGLLSDTALLSHPANAITQQLIQLFNHFLEAVKESLKPGQVPAFLSAWLAEHFSDEMGQTHLAAVKKLEQKGAALGKQKKPRSRASSVVFGEEAILNSRIGKIEVEKKRNAEKGTLDLVKSLTQEMGALTEELEKSSTKKPIESAPQESLRDKTMSADHPDRLYHVMGWMMLFLLSAAVVILALSTFLPDFYQAVMLFLSSHTAVTALLLAVLVMFGICVLFTAAQLFLKSLEASFTSSIAPVQKKESEEIISRQLTLQNPEIRAPGPFSQSVLDLLDIRQSNIKKYTRLIAVIRLRPFAFEENQRRGEFLQRSILGLGQQHFEKHEVRRDEEKDEEAARREKNRARIKRVMMADQEAEDSLKAGYRNRWPQQLPEDDEDEPRQAGYIYGDLRFQAVGRGSDSESEEEFKEGDAAYAPLLGDGNGDESEGSVIESRNLALSGGEGEASEQESEEEEQDDQMQRLLF